MNKIKFYGYKKCSTCVKAEKDLKSKGIEVDYIDLKTQAPSKAVLKSVMKAGFPVKKLLNTSGQLYRSNNMKEKLGKLSEDGVLDVLSQNGMLVKRPIVFDGKKATVGYKLPDFQSVWH